MKPATLKVVPIGSSHRVSLPAPLLARYRIKGGMTVGERPEGILLKAVGDGRLSWEERRQPWPANVQATSLPISKRRRGRAGKALGSVTPEWYSIYPAALDSTVGRERAKTRPVVVVSMEVLNRLDDLRRWVLARIATDCRLKHSAIHLCAFGASFYGRF